MVRLDPDTLEIIHAYNKRADGEVLSLRDDHQLDRDQVEYHNENIASF